MIAPIAAAPADVPAITPPRSSYKRRKHASRGLPPNLLESFSWSPPVKKTTDAFSIISRFFGSLAPSRASIRRCWISRRIKIAEGLPVAFPLAFRLFACERRHNKQARTCGLAISRSTVRSPLRSSRPPTRMSAPRFPAAAVWVFPARSIVAPQRASTSCDSMSSLRPGDGTRSVRLKRSPLLSTWTVAPNSEMARSGLSTVSVCVTCRPSTK